MQMKAVKAMTTKTVSAKGNTVRRKKLISRYSPPETIILALETHVVKNMTEQTIFTDVLIVGAGPVGMTLALTLRRAGVQTMLVDQEERTGTTTRAAIVWPRTLEVFDLLGIVNGWIEQGVPIQAAHLTIGENAAELHFGQVCSPYPVPRGIGHILWTRSDGAAGLWTMNAAGVETTVGPTYGPYPGWTAKAVATASDGTSRVLWVNTNGDAGVWTFSANDVETTIGTTYGPYPGWSAKSVGASGDGTARVLWTNTNGDAGVWSFNAADVETVIGTTYGPYAGYSAAALGVSSDGTSRVLWDNTSRAAGVWSFGANDVESVIGTVYGPY